MNEVYQTCRMKNRKKGILKIFKIGKKYLKIIKIQFCTLINFVLKLF